MIDPSEQLRGLARRVADAYIAQTDARAILLVGSAASGEADYYSDLDLVLYHEHLPSEQALAEARRNIDAERFRLSFQSEYGYGERYYLGAVECQLGHATIRHAEHTFARVVRELELEAELLKIISGLFDGIPLHGADLIERFRRDCTYTDRLRRAMIEKHWKFFPWWYFQERLRTRDANVWRYEVLVRSVYGLLGVLAAINGVYFSTLEFKRAAKFVSRLQVAPTNLAARLEALFAQDERASTADLERLVDETATLVSTHFPDIDLTLQWAGQPTAPGSREAPWTLDEPQTSR